MKVRRLASALLLLAGARFAMAAETPPANAPAAPGPRVVITSPAAHQPLFGPATIAAEVHGGEALTEVAFYVDGSLVARFSRPPYRANFDFGQSNLEHHVRVVASTLFGKRFESSLTTSAIEVGSELDVELVQLFMHVHLWDGRQVSDLGPQDFVVSDASGNHEPVITFSTEEPPLSVVLLVDASDSMAGEPLRRAVEAAKSVTELLRPEDEVMVVLFSDRLLRATEFTRSAATLGAALGDVEAAGGTAVYDHLYYAIDRLGTRLGRPVVILLSDGQDVSSVLDAEADRWRLRRSQATLYWARLRDPKVKSIGYISAWRDSADNARETTELEEAVKESGGRVLDVKAGNGEANVASEKGLETTLQSIFQELRSQVVLGFQPGKRRHDGSWKPISVRGAHGSMQVTTRAGYVDD